MRPEPVENRRWNRAKMPALIGLPFKNGGTPRVGYYSIHTRPHCITPERTSNLVFCIAFSRL
jgi:hypothetical protein